MQTAAVIEFHENHLTYGAKRRGFLLDEADTLLGERITRDDLMAHRLVTGPTTLARLS